MKTIQQKIQSYKRNFLKRKSGGFTLIELLVVVLIIGILAAIALPEYTKAVEKANATEAITMLRSLLTAEKAYKLANMGYTSDLTALDLQLPNIDADTAGKAVTDNWVFSVTVHPLYTSTFTAFAARAKNGITVSSGEYQYGILLSVASDGTETWKCQHSGGNATVPDMCKAVTGTTDGTFK